MNRSKLKEAQERFLIKYPGGFSNPLIKEIAKKHKVEKMVKLTKESFQIDKFENPCNIVDSMCKIISQSSLVSIFEKPKFKDLVNTLNESEKERLALGLKEFLHGHQESGFKLMCGLLNEYKLAKWPLITVCPYYYKPDYEVFIKPTTVKGIIEYFEFEGLKYSSNPDYNFYKLYREQINKMKEEVDILHGNDSAAFCGFLMMAMGKREE